MTTIKPEPLTKDGFAPFGDVLELPSPRVLEVNQGFARRHDDLAKIEVTPGNGDVRFSIFVAQPRPKPMAIKVMERHPLGSQIFYPLQDKRWLILVCDDPMEAGSYRAFYASGGQGVNYARNAWHHPLLVFDADSHFAVVDRKGPGNNLDEVWLPDTLHIQIDL